MSKETLNETYKRLLKEQSEKKRCKFCQEECDGDLILRDLSITMKDGSDVVLCGECLNFYANHEYDKLEKRLKMKAK